MMRKHKDEDRTLRRHGQGSDVWNRLKDNKLAMVGLAIIVCLILVAVFAEWIAPYDYAAQNMKDKFQMPNAQHWLGTDNYGRDLLSRIIVGARVSLLVSLLALVISLVIGGALGCIAGYFGGKVDSVIMRLMDILMAVPALLLAVSISTALGTGIFNTALAIAVAGIAPGARILRANVLALREQEFVEAARATGSNHLRIMFKHILPNTLAPIIVDSTLRLGNNILQISSLSFIGLGIQPPTPEWGSLLNAGREYIRDFYPIVVFPGLAIVLTLFAFNVLGDGLRDALDPKLKK